MVDLRGLEWSKVYLRWSWVYTNLILSKKVTQNAWDGPGSDSWSHDDQNSFWMVNIQHFFSIFQSWRHHVALTVAVTALEWTLSTPRPVARAGAHSMKARSTLCPLAETTGFEVLKPCSFCKWESNRPGVPLDCCIRWSPTLSTQNKSRRRQSRSPTLVGTPRLHYPKKMLFSGQISKVILCPDGPEWFQHRMVRHTAAL